MPRQREHGAFVLASMQADSTLQRVKVYRLNSDGLWDDKGTGHVSVEHMEVCFFYHSGALACFG